MPNLLLVAVTSSSCCNIAGNRGEETRKTKKDKKRKRKRKKKEFLSNKNGLWSNQRSERLTAINDLFAKNAGSCSDLFGVFSKTMTFL